MAKGAGKARKKLPKTLAVVNADNCTGCEACVEVCPVDCIYKVPGEDQPVLQSFVDIDLERCIGCELCERWCPWDAIDMVPTPQIVEAVAQKGRTTSICRGKLGKAGRSRTDVTRFGCRASSSSTGEEVNPFSIHRFALAALCWDHVILREGANANR